MASNVLREVVLPKLDRVKKSGSGFMARCPSHEDGTASLSVTEGDEQPVLFFCHAGCDTRDVAKAIGLDWDVLSKPREHDPRDIQPRQRGPFPQGKWSAVYDYVDEDGSLLFQVLRSPSKDFRQRKPDPSGKDGWSWKLGETRRVLFRLPQVIEAVRDGKLIFICEGEKDVLTCEKAGLVATCNPGGAGKWRPEYAEILREAVVTIIADRDEPGQAHARQVRDSLVGVASYVEIAEAKDGKDATDHVEAGHSLADLTVTWTSEKTAKPDLAPDLWEFLAVEDAPFDWVIEGLIERGDRLILTGFEGLGKALALETPIPTPKGWTTMADLEVGSEVFGPDGKPARVVAATDTMVRRPCYRVRFSDGAEIVADANHMWVTETLPAREATSRMARRSSQTKPRGTDQRHKRVHFPAVRTTEEIAATLHARGGHTLNHSIEVCSPLEYPTQELPLEPYVLGAWLGDGSTAHGVITSADAEVVDRIRAAGVPVTKLNSRYGWTLSDGDRSAPARKASVQARLRALGVLGNKHIPRCYLEASVSQRLEMLRGLMDTDGTVLEQAGSAAICEFSVCHERLATDVLELLHGLGIKVTMRSGPAKLEGRTVGTRWRLSFQTELPVFHLPRKLERLRPIRTRRSRLRYITAVEPVESVPVRCIQVDRADGMFVAGRECIPTHNSQLQRQMAVTAAAGVHPFYHRRSIPPVRVLVIDCENSERQSRRKYGDLAKLAVKLGCKPAPGMLRLIHRTEGINLLGGDAEWLMERVRAHKPDLLFVGPFYRLHNEDMRDEVAARRTVAVLDAVRVEGNCAMVIEAHAGHGEAGKNRSVRPTGSSLLLRWPEFGFGLAPASEPRPGEPCIDVEIRHWRGQRDVREWPSKLTWGGPGNWPWIIPTFASPPSSQGGGR
ncbi:AAA family ATPase [Micromonospora sp. CPCC 205371]|nr:AAA family ATPase [Micromonospora sp. CPCC 205371]